MYVLSTTTTVPGKERIVVPALQGMTPDVASGKIADLGLNVGQISEMFDLKIATGYVISSDPAEGSEVKSKSIINIIKHIHKGIFHSKCVNKTICC